MECSLFDRIGDLLLENSGLRIRRSLRSSDYVFRFEGNDLTVQHALELRLGAEGIHDLRVPLRGRSPVPAVPAGRGADHVQGP